MSQILFIHQFQKNKLPQMSQNKLLQMLFKRLVMY